jgi:hypothetical protein
MGSLAEHRPSEVKHPILKTVVAWDSISALVLGIGTGIAWSLNDYDAQLVWVIPGIALSVSMAVIAWNQWNHVKSTLRGTNYGELLRLIDPNEADIKRPYSVVTYVSLASAIWITVTSFLLDALSQRWESFFIGVGVFLLAWSGLGVVSLKAHSDENDRRVAELEAFKEQSEAAHRELQRQHSKDRNSESEAR